MSIERMPSGGALNLPQIAIESPFQAIKQINIPQALERINQLKRQLDRSDTQRREVIEELIETYEREIYGRQDRQEAFNSKSTENKSERIVRLNPRLDYLLGLNPEQLSSELESRLADLLKESNVLVGQNKYQINLMVNNLDRIKNLIAKAVFIDVLLTMVLKIGGNKGSFLGCRYLITQGNKVGGAYTDNDLFALFLHQCPAITEVRPVVKNTIRNNYDFILAGCWQFREEPYGNVYRVFQEWFLNGKTGDSN